MRRASARIIRLIERYPIVSALLFTVVGVLISVITFWCFLRLYGNTLFGTLWADNQLTPVIRTTGEFDLVEVFLLVLGFALQIFIGFSVLRGLREVEHSRQAKGMEIYQEFLKPEHRKMRQYLRSGEAGKVFDDQLKKLKKLICEQSIELGSQEAINEMNKALEEIDKELTSTGPIASEDPPSPRLMIERSLNQYIYASKLIDDHTINLEFQTQLGQRNFIQLYSQVESFVEIRKIGQPLYAEEFKNVYLAYRDKFD